MRAAALALLAATALAPLAAAAPLDLTFQPPAQAGPGLHATGTAWALLIFGDADAGDADLAAPDGGSLASFTLTDVDLAGAAGQDAWSPDQPPRALGPTEARLSAAGAGSLYVEADAIEAVADGAQAEAVGHRCPRALLTGPERVGLEARYDELCAAAVGAAVIARALDGSMPVRLAVRGLRVAEWHHVAVDCPAQAPECPDGGERSTAQQGPATVRTFGYRRLAPTGADASIQGNLSAARVLLGGPAFDLAVAGQLRLLQARGAGDCACPGLDGRTLRVAGDLRLEGLRPGPDGSLRAALAGDVQAARLDETPVDARVLFGVAGALAFVGVAAVAAKALLAAFTRLVPHELLQARSRRRLMEAIQATPGIHERGLARLTGLAPTTVRHHVDVLAAHGLVRKRRDGRRTRLFDGRPGTPAAAPALEPELRQLDDWLRAHPDAGRSATVRHATASWGWRRSTAYHRLARLEAAKAAGS